MTERRRIEPLFRRPKLSRWLKRAAVVATLLLAAAVGVVVWASRTGHAVEMVRQEILTELSDRCGVQATFTDLKLDPLARDFVLRDLVIRDGEGRQLIAVKSTQVALAFWPLLYGRMQLQKVELVEPEAHIRVNAQGELVDAPACLSGADETGEPMNVGITELAVSHGRFALDVHDTVSAQLDDIKVVLRSRSGGGLGLSVAVDDADIMVRGRPLTLARFRVDGRLEGLLARPRAIILDDLDVAFGRVRIDGGAKVDLLGPVYEANLVVNAPLSIVKQYVPSAPPMSGDARLDVALAGALGFPRASGELVVRRGQVEDFTLGDRLQARFSMDQAGIELRPAIVSMDDGQLAVNARLTFDDQLSVRFDTRMRRLSLARVLDAVGTKSVLADFLGTGRTVLRGTLRPLVLEGPFDFGVRDLHVGDRPWDDPQRIGKVAAELAPDQRLLWIRQGQIAGRWRFADEGIGFSDVAITTENTSGTLSAFLPFGKTERMRLKAVLPNFDFADVGPIAQVPFAGRGSMEATIGGPYDQIGATGRLSLKGAAVSSSRLGDITSNVRWYDQRRLDFTSAVSQLERTRFEGRVGVLIAGAVPLDISGRITRGRIEDLFIPFNGAPEKWGSPSGDMTAKLDLQGPVTRLTGPVEGLLGKGEIYGERWQRGRAVGRFESGRIVFEGLELSKYGGRIIATGSFDPLKGDVRVIARTRGADLQSIDLIRSSQPRLRGKMVARAQIGGSVFGLTGTIAASLTDVRAGPVNLGRARLFGRLNGATLAYDGEGLEGAAQLDGELLLTEGIPYKAKIDLKNVDGPAIMAGLLGHRLWRGNTTMRAELSGGLIDWPRSDGRLQVEELRLETARFTIGTTAPADLTLDQGTLAAERLLLGGPQSQLTVRGRLGASIVDLRVGGRVDLAIAELIGPSIEKAAGQLRLDAAVGGTPAVLNLVGTGRIEGGMLKWRGLENRVTGYTADLTFSQSSVLIDRSVGRFAGGRLGVTGSVLLERFFPKNVALQVNLERARPRFATRTVDVSGVLSGQLTVNGPFQRMLVRGALDVDRGLAEPKIEWSSLVGARSVAAVYDPANEIVDFDILLRSEAGFRVRNQDADVGLIGSFRFTGTNERMGMLGTLPLAQGGRVVFLGREYFFQAGTLNFTERYRFAPRYDLRLTSESCDATITIVLVGTLDTFDLSYRANPEMDQRDIVSCLIRGVKISELDQDLASFAGSALLKLSGVDQEVKKVLLIDQIEVTTEYSSLARAYEPRVLVAKNLSLLDRPARLEYSTSLLRTNDQRAAVRVRLTPQLNLQLGWTSSDDVPFGDWGLDLKQRWEW